MKLALVALGSFVGLALLAPSAQAQMAGVRGKVVDEEGKGVADAKIHIEFVNKPVTYDTQADRKGEYLQLGMELGIYRITATREGYLGTVIDVRVTGVIDAPKIELAVAPPSAADLTEMFNEAVRLAQAGQFDEAEAGFKELLELQPGLAQVHGNLGYIHAQKKDWAKAEASYLSALELSPGDPASMLALSQVYRDSGQDEKAQELLDQMATERPDDAAAQVKRGVFLLNSGKSEEAQAAFEAALAADPATGEAHYHLGTILVGQGKVPEAIEHLEAYLASNPENAQAAETAQGLIDALKK
jgi:predicted Zn-dependent protease